MRRVGDVGLQSFTESRHRARKLKQKAYRRRRPLYGSRSELLPCSVLVHNEVIGPQVGNEIAIWILDQQLHGDHTGYPVEVDLGVLLALLASE